MNEETENKQERDETTQGRECEWNRRIELVREMEWEAMKLTLERALEVLRSSSTKISFRDAAYALEITSKVRRLNKRPEAENEEEGRELMNIGEEFLEALKKVYGEKRNPGSGEVVVGGESARMSSGPDGEFPEGGNIAPTEAAGSERSGASM